MLNSLPTEQRFEGRFHEVPEDVSVLLTVELSI